MSEEKATTFLLNEAMSPGALSNDAGSRNFQHGYLAVLRSTTSDQDEACETERLDYLRTALKQTTKSFEELHGPELALRVQLCFLQGFPLFLSSKRTIPDAVAFLDNVIGKRVKLYY